MVSIGVAVGDASATVFSPIVCSIENNDEDEEGTIITAGFQVGSDI